MKTHHTICIYGCSWHKTVLRKQQVGKREQEQGGNENNTLFWERWPGKRRLHEHKQISDLSQKWCVVSANAFYTRAVCTWTSLWCGCRDTVLWKMWLLYGLQCLGSMTTLFFRNWNSSLWKETTVWKAEKEQGTSIAKGKHSAPLGQEEVTSMACALEAALSSCTSVFSLMNFWKRDKTHMSPSHTVSFSPFNCMSSHSSPSSPHGSSTVWAFDV